MSNSALNWAWEQPCGTCAEKIVLAALADHHNDETGRCNPGLARLCRYTSLTRQGVINQLKKLAERGLLAVEHLPGKNNSYILLVNRIDPSTVLTRQPDILPLVNHVDTHQSTPLTGLVNHVDPNHNEPEVQPEVQPPRQRRKNSALDDEAVEQFCRMDAYAGIDVRREHGKAMAWCSVNQRQCNKRFFVNWLNRAKPDMETVSHRATPMTPESRAAREAEQQRISAEFTQQLQAALLAPEPEEIEE